jgi:hypothetical protein
VSDSPLIKLELGTAANTFVEKVAAGFGVLYEPKRIRKKAKADADAMVTLAKAKSKVTQIEKRAIQRLLAEGQRNQENMESILAQAVPQIEENARPDEIDDDWLTNFFEKAKLTSDEEMQFIWSRLLAGEVNNPSTFSKRTVNLVAEIEKRDAQLFAKLANFTWDIGGYKPLVYDSEDEIYQNSGINFTTLNHLDALGLIRFDPLSGFKSHRPGKTGGTFMAIYIDSGYIVHVPEGRPAELTTGKVLLTTQGSELMGVCTPERIEGFEDYVIKKLAEAQLTVNKLG